jgi:uncharacterized protein YozE (UPF0346 family)
MRKCTPQEIIKEIPDVQTVILPDYWFDELSDSQSVFTSLYDWMLKNGRIPSENEESLHDRTYVGEKLLKKIRAAEKKRLQRRHNIKGEELERVVNWSDLGSGPMTEIKGCKISGDVILVIPASSRQALSEFSSKIHKRERDAAINKIKANAAGATFYHWLLSQIERPDRIGDVARDAADDTTFPRESNQYEEMKSYLKTQRACSAAIESLKEAWLEYLQQYPDRAQPFAWCSECGKRIDIDDAILSLSEEASEVYVLDTGCLNKYKQRNEMVSYPLSDMSYDKLEEFVKQDGKIQPYKYKQWDEWDETDSYDLSDMSYDELKELIEQQDEEIQPYADKLSENLVLWGVLPVVIEGLVYFVQSEKTCAIKIGFTTSSIEKWISSLQTAHPYKLRLLATIPGNREYEKSLHKQFSRFRLNGEWFQAHPDLLNFIAVISKGVGKDKSL